MTWCTAVHAEVWAILAAGERARGGELYTTTHPCFQCAEKIAQAGIRRVCFTEAYPDADSAKRLTMAGVELVQFEGVRSASFERIFARNRPA
jgi:dCMP deaminase